MSYPCETAPTGVARDMAARFAGLVPEIGTERLRLRAPRLSDFAIYAEITCSKRGQYMGGPFSREDAWYDFVQLASGWMLRGHGGWAITTDGDQCLGFVLLGFEPGDQEVELGFLLSANAEGHGYAQEAAKAVRDWAFATYGWNTLISYVDEDNARSRKLVETLGATRDTKAEAALGDDLAGMRAYRHVAVGAVQ